MLGSVLAHRASGNSASVPSSDATTPIYEADEAATSLADGDHGTAHWFGALDMPAEVSTGILNLKNAVKTPLRLSGARPTHTRPASSFNTVVIPSMHGKSHDSPILVKQSRDVGSERVSKLFASSCSFIHNSVNTTHRHAAVRGKTVSGKDIGGLLGNGCLRLAVMGDTGVGKSALVNRFIEGTFSEDYYPTTESRYRKTVNLDSSPCTLEILDTSGNFKQRESHYFQTCHGFMLVFNVNDPSSFEKVRDIRNLILLAKGDQHAPIIIVATQCDKATEYGDSLLAEYHTKARTWGCDGLLTVSATSPRCVNSFYSLARRVRDHYLQLLSDDGQTFDPNFPGIMTPRSSRPPSVKSAPARLGHRRTPMKNDDEFKRSQSVGSLSQDEKAMGRHGKKLLGSLRLRGLGRSRSLGSKSGDNGE